MARYYWGGGKKKEEGCKVSLKLAELFLFLGEVKSRGEGYVVVDIMIDRGNGNRNSSLNLERRCIIIINALSKISKDNNVYQLRFNYRGDSSGCFVIANLGTRD